MSPHDPTRDAGEPVRLSKRVAAMVPCSRSEAERYIEGGWVRVDGQVVEIPQQRVLMQTVSVDPDASLMAVLSVENEDEQGFECYTSQFPDAAARGDPDLTHVLFDAETPYF